MDLKNKTTSSSDLLFWECLIGDILGTHFHVLLCYYVWMFLFIHVALCFLEIAFVRWYCLYSMNVMCLVVELSSFACTLFRHYFSFVVPVTMRIWTNDDISFGLTLKASFSVAAIFAPLKVFFFLEEFPIIYLDRIMPSFSSFVDTSLLPTVLWALIIHTRGTLHVCRKHYCKWKLNTGENTKYPVFNEEFGAYWKYPSLEKTFENKNRSEDLEKLIRWSKTFPVVCHLFRYPFTHS